MQTLKNDDGFSVVETLLLIVIIGILGFTGWYVYHAQKAANKDYSANPSVHVNTTKATSKYDGWKSYTTKYDKLSFKYPSDWQLIDTSNSDDADVTPGQDWIKLIAKDSLGVSIITGDTMYDGGNASLQVIASTKINTLGHDSYLQFLSDSDTTSGATLTTANAIPTTNIFPTSKHIHLSQATLNNPAIQGMPSPFDYITLVYNEAPGNPNRSYPVKKFLQDPSIKTAFDIISSMSY